MKSGVQHRSDDVDLERDRTLVERCQAGDSRAFEDLYLRYRERLHRFCLARLQNSAEAEDAVQEAFARAWRALPSFEGERRFYPWLSVIAGNLCIDMQKKNGRSTPVEYEDLDLLSPTEPCEQEALSDADGERDLLKRALAKLCDRHREVLELREGRNWTYQQIAAYAGVEVSTIETLLFRARKSLKREFMALARSEGALGVILLPLYAMRRLLRRIFSGTKAGIAAAKAGLLAPAAAAPAIGGAVAVVATATLIGTAVAAAAAHRPLPPHVSRATTGGSSSHGSSAAESGTTGAGVRNGSGGHGTVTHQQRSAKRTGSRTGSRYRARTSDGGGSGLALLAPAGTAPAGVQTTVGGTVSTVTKTVTKTTKTVNKTVKKVVKKVQQLPGVGGPVGGIGGGIGGGLGSLGAVSGLPSGSLPSGSLPSGSLPSGSLPSGSDPSGAGAKRSLPSGSAARVLHSSGATRRCFSAAGEVRKPDIP